MKELHDELLYKEKGDRLEISTGTVRQHIHNIYEKRHVQNWTEPSIKRLENNWFRSSPAGQY